MGPSDPWLLPLGPQVEASGWPLRRGQGASSWARLPRPPLRQALPLSLLHLPPTPHRLGLHLISLPGIRFLPHALHCGVPELAEPVVYKDATLSALQKLLARHLWGWMRGLLYVLPQKDPIVRAVACLMMQAQPSRPSGAAPPAAGWTSF